jgi:hypothetical protein
MGSRAVKSEILNAVCAVTGYSRDYARRALRLALTPREVKVRALRPPKYDAEVVAALEKCWAVASKKSGILNASTACRDACDLAAERGCSHRTPDDPAHRWQCAHSGDVPERRHAAAGERRVSHHLHQIAGVRRLD